MRFRAFVFNALLAISGGPVLLSAAPHDQVVIPPTKTSIYVGSVTLTPTTLRREAGRYRADYQAKVFPYFFYNEAGQLWIDFSDAQLAQLARGERVEFSGTAKNKDGEDRTITGHATADAPGAAAGKIKVRILVSPKIELIFNSTYAFKTG
jgi:hypothetical protein